MIPSFTFITALTAAAELALLKLSTLVLLGIPVS